MVLYLSARRSQPLLTRRRTVSPGSIQAERSAFLLCAKSGWFQPLFPYFIRPTKKGVTKISANDLLINEEIRDREVRLIDQDGTQLGVMSAHAALELAEEKQLDLVKIAPNAKPPVCKIMDYGKYRFEQAKREREIRKNQKVIEIKEVRLSATIEDHDIEVKYKAAAKFLQDGNKVKVSIRFRGRQISHSEIGADVMKDFAERCKDIAVVERRPVTEGRNMTMVLAPKE